ncbi:MAG: DUF1028 domain-containing protein [Deltaproteobacteria bacterium]|nr:DUF1028 domain-containing protein [Deltaproteobacteria bacterium]MBI3389435.1 DUF1028 domain-containing protein [Deltaproteobacteria bacterium]
MVNRRSIVATFLIAAYDAATKSWGVAVQSRFLAAGSVVPWARAGIGAVATQALANPRYGPLGLAMLEQEIPADEVVSGLIGGDGGRELRQVGVVDRTGRAAAFTGNECLPWAGHIIGDGFCCQGNILAGEAVVGAMARAIEHRSDLPFAERLIAVLGAGQAAGGDCRGQQSAALLVVRAHGGIGGYSDRAIDLRVDDHSTPIAELQRLLGLHRETFGNS